MLVIFELIVSFILTIGVYMQKGSFLTAILRSDKTVFTSKDIALLWHDPGSSAARVRLNYYVKKGDLYRIRKGLYAKSRNYNKLELATRIYTPSYVSFETVLAKEGLIFQFYEEIFVASYLTREIIADQQIYSYRKIKDEVLTNTIGVEHVNETSTATKERAFLDALYVNADYQFDNLRSLNWENVFKILPIYNNQRMAKKVNSLYKTIHNQLS
jgi:predicted transcriptional regulator of viral defense system